MKKTRAQSGSRSLRTLQNGHFFQWGKFLPLFAFLEIGFQPDHGL